ncbi:Armadillo-like helical-containing protein [Dioscorea alata]|uniref:Armadillo-like helical-containing protein n=1 Tax=Dioscorea alata TaxID=55571 RepID=A0ACB7W953_DIOAL|nr:Armadillo-like helical-containing protein [Dioscorea alata]
MATPWPVSRLLGTSAVMPVHHPRRAPSLPQLLLSSLLSLCSPPRIMKPVRLPFLPYLTSLFATRGRDGALEWNIMSTSKRLMPLKSHAEFYEEIFSNVISRNDENLSNFIYHIFHRNKDKIVKTGAVPHLVELLRSENCGLRELATAAILTLSASDANKTIIAASGVVPLLVQILVSGGIQGKVDAVTALYNLSICKENTFLDISVEAITPLLALLKDSKKYSKFAEKATSLLGILAKSEEARCVIAESDGAILTLVETVEEGSPLSTEYAVGILLSLCKGCREKYRELILKEGAIPGLLLLTADGTTKARVSAHELLDLLRDESKPKRVPSEDLETIVYDIATRVDGPERAEETAKKLLHDMVRRNMELSINKLQHRAALHTPNVPLT